MNNLTPRYPLADLNNAPEDIKTKLLAVQEKAGFVPQVFLMLARRPDEFRAFFFYHDALMLRDTGKNGLTKGDKEMIVVATSAANQCLYCVVAHGALLRIYEKKPLVADITARQRAMLDFALKIATNSAAVNDADFAALEAVGFTSEDAWDIGAIASFFALSNRMANMSGMLPNPEFYLMGRVPR
jgi:uncharacterized peroxidase-related enzyme